MNGSRLKSYIIDIIDVIDSNHSQSEELPGFFLYLSTASPKKLLASFVHLHGYHMNMRICLVTHFANCHFCTTHNNEKAKEKNRAHGIA